MTATAAVEAAPDFSRFAAFRRCPGCLAPLPEGCEAPACGACGRPLCPPHATWPANLKWFLLWQYARARFYPWKSEQEVWEDLLRDTYNGVRTGVGPNPHGLTSSVTAAAVFPRALDDAQRWRADGAPLIPHAHPNDSRE